MVPEGFYFIENKVSWLGKRYIFSKLRTKKNVIFSKHSQVNIYINYIYKDNDFPDTPAERALFSTNQDHFSWYDNLQGCITVKYKQGMV